MGESRSSKKKGEGVEGEGGYCELFGLAPGAKNFTLMEILKIWRMVVVIGGGGGGGAKSAIYWYIVRV